MGHFEAQSTRPRSTPLADDSNCFHPRISFRLWMLGPTQGLEWRWTQEIGLSTAMVTHREVHFEGP